MLKGAPKVGVPKVGKPKVGVPGVTQGGSGHAPASLVTPKMRFNAAANSQLLAVLDDF